MMPEGPEIRRSRDSLAEVLDGKQLEKIDIGLETLQTFQPVIAGRKVLRVDCQGKAMLIHLDNGKTIYSHNQLYGIWYITARNELPNTKRSLRLALHTKNHSAILYSASEIEVWETDELNKHPFLSKIGPDILDITTTKETVLARLQSSRFCRRSLAALYLDQHFIAGLGNYLRSEILFFAGCIGQKRPADYDRATLGRLAENTLTVATRSYKTGGYTIPDNNYHTAVSNNAGYHASRFMVFDREGLACRRCGEEIRRDQLSGRRFYFCPNCQH